MLPISDLKISTEALCRLYGCSEAEAPKFAARYEKVLQDLDVAFGPHEVGALFRAPGRPELGGNPTDHQHRPCFLLTVFYFIDELTFFFLANPMIERPLM